MNTDHMKIHFTSQICIEFVYSQSIIYEYLTWLQTGALTLVEKMIKEIKETYNTPYERYR